MFTSEIKDDRIWLVNKKTLTLFSVIVCCSHIVISSMPGFWEDNKQTQQQSWQEWYVLANTCLTLTILNYSLLILLYNPDPYKEHYWAWAKQWEGVRLNLVSACSHLSHSCLTSMEEGLPCLCALISLWCWQHMTLGLFSKHTHRKTMCRDQFGGS